ncbi:MAG: phosphatase domain-containing protein [Spirulinaceae cyanobacterium]
MINDMVDWQQAIAHTAHDVEQHFDKLSFRLKKRLGINDPLQVLPYLGYGTKNLLRFRGRVLEDEGITKASDRDTTWHNLLNMYKRLESDEVPGAKVRVVFNEQETEVVADEEGYFLVELPLKQPLAKEAYWQEVNLELVEPKSKKQSDVTAVAKVLIPPEKADFGIISDIDDTILQTHAFDWLQMARLVFLDNARTRLPFLGVASFYQALQKGAKGESNNPIFYVSSSPWNFFDLLQEFIELNEIPIGPLLLRDYGLSQEDPFADGHESHKLSKIKPILELYTDLSFILIGDSGQKDPEIYTQVVKDYPGRILAIYIRDVTTSASRQEAINKLATEVSSLGSELILVPDTVSAAKDAIEKGLIPAISLPAIEAQKEEDAKEPGELEQLLSVNNDQ